MWTNSARRQYERLGGRYATDLTNAEFALIEPFLPPPRPGGRSRTTRLREVPNAILYVLQSGCQWRLLPTNFPLCSTVYEYFRQFWQLGIWTRIWASLLMEGRELSGKDASPSAAIVNSQSAKTRESGGIRGFDAGKKIMSRKRHLLTDTLGPPLVITVHSASVHQDRDGFELVVVVEKRFPWLRSIFADSGYNAMQTPCAAAQNKLRLYIVKRSRDALGFHLLPRPLRGLLTGFPSGIG